MQRVECKASAEAIEAGTASCIDSGKVALSIGVKLKIQSDTIRVLPYAYELTELKPQHRGGENVVAATLQTLAIGFRDDERAGFSWQSEALPIGSMSCEVGNDRQALKGCLQEFDLSELPWLRAPVMPLPPDRAQAFVFSVGEVGLPPQGLKGFCDFLEATKDDISGAWNTAFQKKIKLAEE